MSNNKETVKGNFFFTEDQQEAVCRHFGHERSDLDDWQVAELLDKLIDEATAND